MLMGIFGILLGESMLFGSMPIFYWFVIAVILNCVYIPLFDETGMEHRFGEGYVIYKKNVPRWIPRSQPWDGQDTKSRSMDKKNT
jgi:protein-S-isoprenylcysteine O-methyltransferase Ste14